MSKDLLGVIERESTEDSQTSVQPEVLSPHQSASSGSWKDKWRKTGECDDCDTGEQRSTDVQVLLLLSSSTDEGNGAHHSNRVESSASEDSRREEKQGTEERSLCNIETGPQSVLDHVVLRRRGVASHHRTKRSHETNTENKPWIRTHQPVRPTVHMESASGNSDDSDSQSGVQESVIQITSLKWWHSSIFSCFAVEDQVDGKQRSSKDCAAVQQALGDIALREWVLWRRSLVSPLAGLTECLSEDILLLRCKGVSEWRRLLEDGLLLCCLRLEAAEGVSCRRGFR